MGYSLKGFLFLFLTLILFMVNFVSVKVLYVKLDHFEKPFFITYLSTLTYSLLICKNIFSCKPLRLLSHIYEFKMSLIYTPLFFFYLYLNDLGIMYTNLSSVTIIGGSSMIIIAFLSKFILDRKITLLTITSLLISFAGIAIIGLADNRDNTQSSHIIGDIIIFASILIYSLNTTLLKKLIPEGEENFDYGVFFFYIAFFSAILFFPVFFVLNETGIEVFEFPNQKQLCVLLITAILGYTLADYAYAKTVILLSPLLMDMGLCLNTPLAMIADIILESTVFSVLFLIGLFFAILGFCLILVDENLIIKEKNKLQQNNETNALGKINISTESFLEIDPEQLK